jgi:DeoR family transcriptional regulator, deoxyribose operon repressor
MAGGASCSNFHEVVIKQAAIASAMESILVVDESKLPRPKPAFFSDLDAFSRIIVGGHVSRDVRKQFKGLRVEYVTEGGK